jgi:hypothetical protein
MLPRTAWRPTPATSAVSKRLATAVRRNPPARIDIAPAPHSIPAGTHPSSASFPAKAAAHAAAPVCYASSAPESRTLACQPHAGESRQPALQTQRQTQNQSTSKATTVVVSSSHCQASIICTRYNTNDAVRKGGPPAHTNKRVARMGVPPAPIRHRDCRGLWQSRVYPRRSRYCGERCRSLRKRRMF